MSRPGTSRWIVGAAAAVVAIEVALVFAAYGAGLDGVRGGIRATARSSLLLFAVTFAASSLVALQPAPWSKWLLRHRRHLGLSFAVSHGVHLGLIVVFALGWPDTFAARGPLTGDIIPTIAYLVLLAMVLTSTDGARARLGGRRWKALHKSGMYLVWTIFTFVYLGRTSEDVDYLPALVLLISVLALRAAARLTRRALPRQPRG